MIVYGGLETSSWPFTMKNDGGVYDPSTNTWSTLSTVNAPNAVYATDSVKLLSLNFWLILPIRSYV